MALGPGMATEVELSVACRDLPNGDVKSKSDPLVVFFLRDGLGDGGKWREEGRTERLSNTLHPVFAKRLRLSYHFEAKQELRCDVYDVDSSSERLKEQDFLGRAKFTLARLASSPQSRLELQLDGASRAKGTIIVALEEVNKSKEVADFKFHAKKLDNKDWVGKSDPFLSILRINDDQSTTLLHRTEVIKNDLNPSWRPFSVPVGTLTRGFPNRLLLMQVFDSDSDGGHDLIGEARASYSQLAASNPKAPLSLELINTKKQAKKKGYKNSGLLILSSFSSHPEYSFLDFIRGGTQMHFTVAVDFTASNGNPVEPTSLHFIHPHQPNPYMLALKAVGDIIAEYDEDAQFPALGFGGKLPDGGVSHEFFLNGHPTDPHCGGVDGVLAAYKNALLSVQLYGPTNFAAVINHVAKFAAAAAVHRTHYFVLLILTDGEISDFEKTVEAIVAASSLPMSIIVVGVGKEKFEAMKALDADQGRLKTSAGKEAQRDIVQFVRFSAYQGSFEAGADGASSEAELGQARLARDVLKEIPLQLTSYMNSRRFAPLQPPQSQPNPSSQPSSLYPTSVAQQPAFNPAFAESQS